MFKKSWFSIADTFDQPLDVGATPTFAGATLSGLTASTVIYSNANKAITSLANSAGYLLNDGSGGLSWGAVSFAGYLKADGTVPLTAAWTTAYPLLVPNGTAGAPSVAAASDTNTGIYFNGSDILYLTSGGTVSLQIYGASTFIEWLTITNQAKITAQNITAGSGTGLTVNATGHVNRQVYKVTVDYTGFSAADTHAHHVIATLPAKTRIVSIIADTTVKYLGGAVSAATLEVGKTTDTGVEYILPHDVFTAVVNKGLADADLGNSINRANAVYGGDLPSWTAATDITATIRTTNANTSALTQGSTTFYIVAERF